MQTNPEPYASPLVNQAKPDSLVGRFVAEKFQLLQPVGAGSSGTVYQAVQKSLGRTVAVKILRPELASDPRFVRRFHDEALVASKLNHPNIVSVFDYGQTQDGLLYLVMEFLHGSTLTHLFRSQTLTAERISDIMGQILAGLEEAHAAGIVHADLKSDNIIVDPRRGDWDLVKVVDFGIARLMGQESPALERTICGTPEYMSPEVITGSTPTPAADIYAAGCLLYELLTGHTPFAGGSASDVLRRHVGDEPQLPSVKFPNKTIPGYLQDAAMRALCKHAEGRFTDAREFRSAILRAQKSEDLFACNECGNIATASFKFCPECGNKRRADTAPLSPKLVTHRLSRNLGDAVPTQKMTRTGTARSLGVTLLRENEGLARPFTPHTTSDFPVERPTPEFDQMRTLDVTPESVQALVADPGSFLGRVEEKKAIISALLQAEPPFALVGPSGVGKKRLLQEVFRSDSFAGWSVTVIEPDPSTLSRPLIPLINLINSVLGLDETSTFAEVETAVHKLRLTPRDVPGLCQLLGIESPLHLVTQDIRNREMNCAAARFIRTVASYRNSIVVFADADQYDAATFALLEQIINLPPTNDEPTRIVVTCNYETISKLPDTMGRMALSPLSELDFAHSPDGEATTILRKLREKAGGLPSHLQQLAWFVQEGADIANLPASEADAIAARLDTLPHSARLVGQALAAHGMQASVDDLRQILGDDQARDDVREALSILSTRHFITALGPTMVSFTSTLVRSVIYEATPADVRRMFHEMIIANSSDIMSIAWRGHHHLYSGNYAQAARMLTLAGDQDVALGDTNSARRFYTQALWATRNILWNDEETHYAGLFADISIRLADCLRKSGQIGLARGVLQEASDVVPPHSTSQTAYLRCLASVELAEKNVNAAFITQKEAIAAAIRLGNLDMLCELYLDLAALCARHHSVARSIEELEEGINLVTAGEGAASTQGPQELWRLLTRAAQLVITTHKPHDALFYAERALRHSIRAKSEVGIATNQGLLAQLYQVLGHSRVSEEFRTMALSKWRQLGDRRATLELLTEHLRITQLVQSDFLRVEAAELSAELGGGALPPPRAEEIYVTPSHRIA